MQERGNAEMVLAIFLLKINRLSPPHSLSNMENHYRKIPTKKYEGGKNHDGIR